MKNLFFLLTIFGLLILDPRPVAASNPISLILLSAPIPLATIDITVDLQDISCAALDCSVWKCDIYAWDGSSMTLISSGQTATYNGNQTYPFTGMTVPSGTTRIYCKWYFVGSYCQWQNDVWCYTRYVGQPSDTIDCNPCSQ